MRKGEGTAEVVCWFAMVKTCYILLSRQAGWMKLKLIATDWSYWVCRGCKIREMCKKRLGFEGGRQGYWGAVTGSGCQSQ
eukprot:1159844-Pelagomonas_calceolata.AAC.4